MDAHGNMTVSIWGCAQTCRKMSCPGAYSLMVRSSSAVASITLRIRWLVLISAVLSTVLCSCEDAFKNAEKRSKPIARNSHAVATQRTVKFRRSRPSNIAVSPKWSPARRVATTRGRCSLASAPPK
eukprot:scaffold88449_cov30-Tisochrysis_lutea.AAC.7